MQNEQQPGWTFSPGQDSGQPPATPQPSPSVEIPAAPSASPAQQPPPNESEPVVPSATPQANEVAPPAASQQPPAPATQTGGDGISWTASEFIEHDKTAGWYVGVLFVAALGIAAIYLITRDIFSVVVLIIFTIAFIALGARKPKELSYNLTSSGIQVGEKFYAFGQFKSFAVIDEGMIRSITLLPLKRFMPGISVYYAPQDEQQIVEFLGASLPHEERKQDAVDRFMHRIRF